MLDQVVLLLVTGFALLLLVPPAVAVPVDDAAGAGTRRGRAEARRRAWEARRSLRRA